MEATEVGPALDERLDGLTSVPPEHYLAAGRVAQRRRRRHRGGAAAVLVAAAALVGSQVLPFGGDTGRATEHRPAIAASDGPISPPSLSDLKIEAGVGQIDSYTTDEIPKWAQEYGNHGPAAIAPDGRLWIAPEAEVVRSIADPVDATSESDGVGHSYAIEARWSRPGVDLGKDGLVWWIAYQDAHGSDFGGTMDDPDRWTCLLYTSDAADE